MCQDLQHNSLEGPLPDHIYNCLNYGCQSVVYPDLSIDSFNEAMMAHPWDAIVDDNGVDATKPFLLHEKVFKDKSDTPHGNRFKWTSGMTMAFVHDIVPILGPLLKDKDGSFATARDDEIWEGLFDHCRFFKMCTMWKFTRPILEHMQDLWITLTLTLTLTLTRTGGPNLTRDVLCMKDLVWGCTMHMMYDA